MVSMDLSNSRRIWYGNLFYQILDQPIIKGCSTLNNEVISHSLWAVGMLCSDQEPSD